MKHIDLTPFEGRALDERDWQHIIMRILFTPRGKNASYADALAKKASKQQGLCAELPDPLLNLLGFDHENMPEMTSAFNSEMGFLFETIVRVAFKLSDNRLYTDEFDKETEKLSFQDLEKFKKIKSDFLFGTSGVEVKYRYGSHEGFPKQIEAALPLKIMGFQAVMLSLRRSPNTDVVRRNGNWTVHEGQDTLDYIQERTGFDLKRIFVIASANPLIAKRIEEFQRKYNERTKAKLESSFFNALEGHRTPIHRLIVTDADSRASFLKDVGFEDDLIGGFLNHILKEGPAVLKDPVITSIVSEANKKINFASESRKAG